MQLIRRLATTDNTFGGDPSVFRHLFVIDGVVAGGREHRPAARAFDPGVKAGIAKRLADLAPLKFVTDPESVIDREKGCATVRDHGALIYLGQIKSARSTSVTVRGQLFVACLAGGGATYVVKPASHRWRVVGIIGGRSIS